MCAELGELDAGISAGAIVVAIIPVPIALTATSLS